MKRFLKVFGVVAALCIASESAFAQNAPEEEPARSTGGLSVQSLTLSASRFSESVPAGIIAFPEVFLGTANSVSGSAAVNWTKSGSKGFFTVDYLSSYGVTYMEGRPTSWNHAVSTAMTRPIARKWQASLAADAGVMSFEQALFYPSTIQKIAAANANVREIADAVSQRTTTDPTVATITQRPSDIGDERFMFGRRTANVGGQVGLAYNRSRRVTLAMAVGGSRIRQLTDESIKFEFPDVITTSGGASLSYAVSGRTLITIGANALQSDSPEFSAVGQGATASLTRTFRRFFYSASTGFASTKSGRETHQTITFATAFGIKTRNQILIATYDRGLGDRFNAALGRPWWVDTVNAAWHLSPQRSNWWFDSTFLEVHNITTGVATTDTWRQRETFGRGVSQHFAVILEHTVGRVGSRRYVQAGRRYQLHQNAYQVSLTWFPQSTRVRRQNP